MHGKLPTMPWKTLASSWIRATRRMPCACSRRRSVTAYPPMIRWRLPTLDSISRIVWAIMQTKKTLFHCWSLPQRALAKTMPTVPKHWGSWAISISSTSNLIVQRIIWTRPWAMPTAADLPKQSAMSCLPFIPCISVQESTKNQPIISTSFGKPRWLTPTTMCWCIIIMTWGTSFTSQAIWILPTIITAVWRNLCPKPNPTRIPGSITAFCPILPKNLAIMKPLANMGVCTKKAAN